MRLVLAAHELAQPADDLARAQSFGADLAHGFPQFREIRLR